VKPIRFRAGAQRDAEDAVRYYRREAGERVALAFVEALQSAYRLAAEHPQSGSGRYSHQLGLPGLRARPLRNYPYLVFYLEHSDHVDIWRVLHAQRDVPHWLQE
jgi:toxin ParE1/3/4